MEKGADMIPRRVVVHGVERQVVLSPDGTGWRVQLDGVDYGTLALAPLGRAEWMMTRNGVHAKAVGAYLDGDAVDLHLGGSGLRVEVSDGRATRSGAAGRGASGQIRVPMPGVVTRVLVAVGDRVVAGQVLAVVEAMKMENEFRSPVPGVVSELAVQVGQAVEGGALLAVVATT